jgi:hypothetical protein
MVTVESKQSPPRDPHLKFFNTESSSIVFNEPSLEVLHTSAMTRPQVDRSLTPIDPIRDV